MIITHNDSLKRQWMATFLNMFDYRQSDLMNIKGSHIMEAIVADMVTEKPEVYFINHQTLRSYLSTHGPVALHQFFRKLKIGIKVYDESHLEFANILLMDMFSNTARTWYLTATFDRSDKSESACFKKAFSSLEAYGERESVDYVEKHVVYHAVYIKSRPSPEMMRKIMKYGGMTAASYGHYAFGDDLNYTAYRSIKLILEKTKDLDGKTLIFVPLIDAVDRVAQKLKTDFPDKSVGVYHSRVDKEEKLSAEKKDIIVSTIKSCGTGKDIPGLRVLICLEPIASKVQAQQLIGRLRPFSKDKFTYFFDVIDTSIPTINWWFRARYRKIATLVKQTIYLNLDS
jgi:superfamily II DNA or RNA helicase